MRALFAAGSAALVLVAFACSDFDGDAAPAVTQPDAGVDGASGGPGDSGPMLVTDADTVLPTTPTCASKPFEKPVLVTGTTLPENALCFILSPTEKVGFYNNANGRMFTVPIENNELGIPSPLSLEVNANSVGCTAFTATGNLAFNEDFFLIYRQKRLEDGGYGSSEQVLPTGLDADRYLAHPFIDHVTGTLYVTVGRTNGPLAPPFGIARASILGSGAVGAFTSVDLAGDLTVHRPVISADSLSMYFATQKRLDAGDDTAKGTDDIWVATRATPNDTFKDPHPVDGVNSPSQEAPTYISSDGCRLFMISTVGSSAGYRFFVATRTP